MKSVLVAPAKRVDKKHVELFVEYCKQNGIECEVADYLFSGKGYFSGTDNERRSDLQKALDSEEFDIIFCARGGYGTTRFIDDLDFKGFKKNPKTIIGFSDITVLLNHISRLGFFSIHASVGGLFDSSNNQRMESFRMLIDLLKGHECKLTAPSYRNNVFGKASGKVVGGNLSLICNSLRTSTELDMNKSILALEEVDEYLYAIDRMLVQLKRSNSLNGLSGVIVGDFSSIKDGNPSFGQTVEEIILDHIPNNIPIAFGHSFGHEDYNVPFYIGREAELSVTKSGSRLTYS